MIGRVVFRWTSHSPGLFRIEAWRWTFKPWTTRWRAAETTGTTRTHGVLLRKAGVETNSIAMPQIDSCIRERFAGMRIEQHNAKRKRHSRLLPR